MRKKPLKILFVIRSADQFIYYKSIIEVLLARGNTVRLLYDRKWTEKKASINKLEEFGRANNNFEFAEAVLRRDNWRKILFHTRELLSYRSYLLGERKNLRKFYRDRWRSYLPGTIQKLVGYKFPRFIVASSPAGALLRAIENIAPPDKNVLEDIKKYAPDVLFASPGNMRFSSADVEYLKAAKSLNIPTVVSVVSWDNLTNKGLFHVFPDKLLVWNEEGKKEAISHHNIPANSVKIIGAPLFDQWFGKLNPSQTREEFCKKNGLNPAHPIILYLGSSVNIAQDESWVVEEMRRELDKDPFLKNTQIIIRPHPANKKIYERLNLKGVTVLPKEGALPDSKDSFALFNDMLQFSVCTIGVNTSGQIDAIIAGKPGLAFMPEKYKESQMETKHFMHLYNSGAFEGVKDGKEFVIAFKKLLDGNDTHKQNREQFIKSFIRPNGLEKSAGECAAEEIENLTN